MSSLSDLLGQPVPFKRLANPILGKMLQPAQGSVSDRAVPFLKAGHVQWSGLVLPEELPTMWASASDMRVLNPVPGDLLICEGGEVGRAALAPSTLPANAIIQNSLHLVRESSTASPRYLKHALEHVTSSGWVDLICNKATIAHLTVEKLRALEVPYWPKSDQERIANFLDDKTARIDALIAEKEHLADALRDIEEVTAFDFVTRGLAPSVQRAKFSEVWLREVPAHWSLSKIRHIATVGNGSTPKRDNAEYWEEKGTPWLNSGSVNSVRITEASDFVSELACKECHLPRVRAGSTVVALTGQGKTRGTAAILNFQTTINQHLAYVSLFDNRMTDEYLWVALTGFYSVLRYISDGEGSTKGALTCEELNKFRVPVPPLQEQVAIIQAYSERISAIEGLRENVYEHIARLREYRSSLISAAVTGQIGVGAYEVAA